MLLHIGRHSVGGADPFGAGTLNFEWDKNPDPIQAAKDKADAAFEFIGKMEFWDLFASMIMTLFKKVKHF